MFTLRFDMRVPEGSASATDLYEAAIEMCSWAETRGAVNAVLSEHHGADDGHLPAPHILASAIAARTKQLAILLAAVPEAADYMRKGRPLPLLPLCGGLPPDVAWPYLERAAMAAGHV